MLQFYINFSFIIKFSNKFVDVLSKLLFMSYDIRQLIKTIFKAILKKSFVLRIFFCLKYIIYKNIIY